MVRDFIPRAISGRILEALSDTRVVVLNGPLGVGKSTLAEVLTESIDQCVMLDGDQLIASNPPYADELEHLHSTVALLVGHHRRFGYRHFVINHLWRAPSELADLRRRLADLDTDVRCFLLTLPIEENLRRVERRAAARARDRCCEWSTARGRPSKTWPSRRTPPCSTCRTTS